MPARLSADVARALCRGRLFRARVRQNEAKKSRASSGGSSILCASTNEQCKAGLSRDLLASPMTAVSWCRPSCRGDLGSARRPKLRDY
jgi:hypothetical protein